MLFYPEKSRAGRKQYVQYHSEELGSEHKSSLPAIPMSHPLHYDVTPSSLREQPQKNSCKRASPRGNVKNDTMAVEPESLPCGERFQTAWMENCLSN